MFERTKQFFSENGDAEVQRIYGVAAVAAIVILPLLGALKGDAPGALVGALVLEAAIGVLYVMFCVNNRQYANHPATKLAVARVEATAQLLGGSPVDSEGYTAASRG